MRTDEIERVRGALDEFAAAVLAPLLKDQRGKGGLYLQGLMPEGRRKSMQSTAARLSVDHRQLQQFVSSSPWLVEPGHRILAHKVVDLLGPVVWAVDDTGFPKDDPASSEVARQYSGT